MASANQLFKKTPDNSLCIRILACFGLSGYDDMRSFSKHDLEVHDTVNRVLKMKPELQKYYVPCKARTYLSDLNTKNVITILRQILRLNGYTLFSREKYVKGEKFILYMIVPISPTCQYPHPPRISPSENSSSPTYQITF